MGIQPGVNLFSGAPGIGAALTNPTELARKKGLLTQAYPVVFQGMRYMDAESAYQALKPDDDAGKDTVMVEILAARFRQYPDLFDEVSRRGGTDWLATCQHLTNARSDSAQRWEGVGLKSRFIRNLIAAYERASQGVFTEAGQTSLF